YNKKQVARYDYYYQLLQQILFLKKKLVHRTKQHQHCREGNRILKNSRAPDNHRRRINNYYAQFPVQSRIHFTYRVVKSPDTQVRKKSKKKSRTKHALKTEQTKERRYL